MKTIQQFQLKPGMTFLPLDIPDGATFLRVGPLGGVIGLWLSVDTTAPTTSRTFRIYGNDEEIPATDEYLGTVPWGAAAKHVFVEPVA